MAHKKTKHTIQVGGEVSDGTRKLRLDAVEGDLATVTLTVKKGETVTMQDPKQRDNPWIGEDPGEGEMVTRQDYVKIGNKIRVGGFRQFRILSFDGTNAEVAVVGPA